MRIGQSSVIHFVSQFSASIAGFVATLYIARELGSAALGTYAVFLAVLIWLKTGVRAGVHQAITKRLSEATGGGKDLGAGIAVQILAFVLVTLVLVLVRERVNDYLSFSGTWLLVVALFVVLVFSLVTSVLHGEQKVHLASLLYPIDSVVRSGTQLTVVFLGVLGGGVVGLVWGYIAGVAVAALAGIAAITTVPRLPERSHFDNVLSFSRYSWLSGIEERSFSAMDTIVLGVFVSSNLIGYYEVAWNLASVLAIFGTSIAQTLFPAISQLDSENKTEAVTELISDGLAYVGLFLVPGLFGVLIIGEQVLVIYGGEFRQAGTVLIILVAARLIYAYEAQFIMTLNAIDRPDTAFKVNAVFVTVNLGLNLLLVYFFGWIGAAVGTALAALVGLVLAFVFVRRFVEFSLPVTEFAKQGVSGVLMAGAVALVKQPVVGLALDPIPTALALVSIGSLCYFGSLLALSRQFRTTIRDNIAV